MQNMNLSMTPYTQAGNFVCSQYDVGRQCQIQLVDENGAYTIPSGATVTVMATKPSGLGFSVDCTWSGSTVTFTTTNTMTNEFGRFPAELRITSGSTLLGTTNFWFKVERSPHPDEVIDSDVIIQKNLVARVTTLEEKMTSVESDITDLKEDLSLIETISIEGYEKEKKAVEGALTDGGYYSYGQNRVVTIASWSCLRVNCEPNTTYLISGSNVTDGRLCYVFDENNTRLYSYPATSSITRIDDYELTTPDNASYIYVNALKAQGEPSVTIKTCHFVKENIDQPSDTELSPGDVVIVDSATEGTRQFDLGAALTDVKADLSLIETISIEGYEKEKKAVEGALTDDGYYSYNQNRVVTIASWSCLRVNCEPNTTYLISGSNVTDGRLCYVFDENNTRLYSYPATSSTTRIDDYELTTPDNASYIYVNALKAQGEPSVTIKTCHFVKENDDNTPMAIQTTGDNYVITAGDFVHNVNLSGSNNGLFNFSNIYYKGNLFKNCSDDITPVRLKDEGYVGANHGYALAYRYTYAEPHGLTEADIGKEYITPTSQTHYILIQVPSTTELIVGRYNATAWSRLLPNVAENTFDFGTGEITATTKVSAQIYPAVKNGKVEIIENTSEKCAICETYDIIDIGSGIEAIKANVGSNTNNSIATLADSALTVRNIYEFHKNGSVVVYQNLKVLDTGAVINWYGGVQSMAFSTSDYFAVAETIYSALTATTSTTVNFTRDDTWTDATIPPALYLQSNGNVSNLTKVMETGYIVPNRNALISNSAGNMQGSSRKMYPYGINPNAESNEGQVYNLVSFRIPIHPSDISTAVPIIGYTYIYDDIYLFVSPTSAINTSIELPEFMWNKKAEVYMSDGVTCDNTEIIDSIDIRCSGTGHLIVKLSN